MECGLGGRLDATNILERVACTAITSIGLDHQEILGDTHEEIAAEKAGIIKAGVGGCVLGPTACPFPVFRNNYTSVGAPSHNFIEVRGLAEESKELDAFADINTEVAMKVLGVTLQKTPEELEQIIPQSFIQEVSQPCRLERITH